MQASVQVQGQTLYPFGRGFSLPKGDGNGFCNNFNSALFMQDSETECTQSFRLTSDCLNLMNPQYWSSLLSIQAGQATNSQSVNVAVSAIYTYSQATNIYTA